MKLSDKIKLAFSDLTHRKVRTLLTIISVSIGALLIIVMLGIGDGVINKMKDIISSFGDTNVVYVMPIDSQKAGPMVSMTGGQQQKASIEEDTSDSSSSDSTQNDLVKKITNQDLNDIKNIDGVKSVHAVVTGNATQIKLSDKDFVDRKIQVMGANFDYEDRNNDDIVAGRNIVDPDTEFLVGENLAKVLGADNKEDLLGKKIVVQVEYPKMAGMENVKVKDPVQIEGTIVGLLKRSDYSDTVLTGYKKAMPIANYFVDKSDYINDVGYGALKVYPNEGVKGSDVANKISSELGYSAFSLSMITDLFNSMGIIVKGVLSIAGIIVLVVASLGLVNTVTMTLQEKKKMIGVMRSVGASRSNIRVIFIFQSLMLGIGGGLLGAVLSVAGILLSNEYITKSNNFVISLSVPNIAVSVIVTVIISLIAGFIPASRAAKLNVVEAVAEE